MSIVEEYRNAAQNADREQIGEAAPLSFDPSKYVADLQEFDPSEDQKSELLVTLWSIMRSFVELGFRADVCALVFSDAEAIPSPDELR